MTELVLVGRSGASGPVLLVQFGQLAIGTIDGRTFQLALLCSQVDLSPSDKRERSNARHRVWRQRRAAKRIAAGTAAGTTRG